MSSFCTTDEVQASRASEAATTINRTFIFLPHSIGPHTSAKREEPA
jgi:hypothetical protein